MRGGRVDRLLPRQIEQLAHQPRCAIDRGFDLLQGIGADRRIVAASGDVGLSLQSGQRRLKLMRGAGEEMAFAVAQSVEPVEQGVDRSEEHTSELQSLMRISYAVFWL